MGSISFIRLCMCTNLSVRVVFYLIYCVTVQLKVTTEQGFHLGGVVESIRIQGEQHPSTKRWQCEDYIVVSTLGHFCNNIVSITIIIY